MTILKTRGRLPYVFNHLINKVSFEQEIYHNEFPSKLTVIT